MNIFRVYMVMYGVMLLVSLAVQVRNYRRGDKSPFAVTSLVIGVELLALMAGGIIWPMFYLQVTCLLMGYSLEEINP